MDIEELREAAASLGYELRRKGRPQEHKAVYGEDGEQLRNCYVPHIVCTASVRARSIKLLDEARRQIREHFGVECVEWYDVYEMLLLMAEHVVRNMKYRLNGMEMSCRLFYLIDKEDYIRNKNRKGGAK